MATPSVVVIILVALLVATVVVCVSVIIHLQSRGRSGTNRQERRMVLYPRPRLSVGSDIDIPTHGGSLHKRPQNPYETSPKLYNTVQFERKLLHSRNEVDRNLKPDAPPFKRRRSHRAPLLIPKARRQKKSDKTIPLQQIAPSPLSAITERSNAESSSRTGIAELPTSITPKDAAKTQAHDENRSESKAWPLPKVEMATMDSGPGVSTARNSGLFRSNSAGYNALPRPTLRRSISLGSQMTTAPEEELPPLPMIYPLDPIDPFRRNSKHGRRFSMLSIDSMASGGFMNYPSTTAPFSSIRRSRKISSASTELSAVDAHGPERSRRPDPTPLAFGSPAGRQAHKVSDRTIPTAKSYQGSIRSPTSPNSSTTQSNFLQPVHDGRLNIQSSVDSSLSKPSPWNKSSKYDQDDSGYEQRHFLIEPYEGSGKQPLTRSHPANTRNDRGSPVRRPTRRASIASSDPLQFDQHFVSIGMPAVADEHHMGQRRGHRRHHGTQISGLPGPDLPIPAQGSPTTRLHQLSEDGNEFRLYNRDSVIQIPDLSLHTDYHSLPTSSPRVSGEMRSRSYQAMDSPKIDRPQLRESIIRIPGLGLLDGDYPSFSASTSQAPTSSVFDSRPDFDPPTNPSIQTKSATITSRGSTPESSVFDSPSPFNPTPPRNSNQSDRVLHHPFPKSPTPTTFTTLTTVSPISDASESLPAAPISSYQSCASSGPVPFRPQARPRGPRAGPPSQSRSSIQKPQSSNRRSVIATAQMLRRMDSSATVSDDAYLNFTLQRRSGSPPPPLPDNSAATIAAATMAPSPSESPVLRIPSALSVQPSIRRPKRDTLLSPFVSAHSLTNGMHMTSRIPSGMSVWDDASVKAESPNEEQPYDSSDQKQAEGDEVEVDKDEKRTELDDREDWNDKRRKKREGIVDGPRVNVPTPTPEEKDEETQLEEKTKWRSSIRSSTSGGAAAGLGFEFELPREFNVGSGWGSLIGEAP